MAEGGKYISFIFSVTVKLEKRVVVYIERIVSLNGQKVGDAAAKGFESAGLELSI